MGRRGGWTPPPDWPKPPPGWSPPPRWTPPATWPPAPAEWDFYPHSERKPAWWRRHWVHLVAVGSISLLFGVAMSAGASSDRTPTARPRSLPADATTATVT